MSEFVFLFHGPPASGTPQQLQAQMQKWATWMKDLGTKGFMKNPGQPLQPTGKIVKDRKKSSSDVQADNTLIGGVMFIEARDLQHAVEISTGCPVFDDKGFVEVRPVMQF
jgi:hypothetical protein